MIDIYFFFSILNIIRSRGEESRAQRLLPNSHYYFTWKYIAAEKENQDLKVKDEQIYSASTRILTTQIKFSVRNCVSLTEPGIYKQTMLLFLRASFSAAACSKTMLQIKSRKPGELKQFGPILHNIMNNFKIFKNSSTACYRLMSGT